MMQAMIFAAGMGTRLKPLTDRMPKALVNVGGTPLLQHVIIKMKNAGFERIVVNVHHFADQIIDYLQNCHYFGLDIQISDEREMLLDTGGGIKAARSLFAEAPILIHNVDILSNIDLCRFYASNTDAAATLLVSHRPTKRYLLFNDAMQLVGWTNIETGEVRSPFANLRPADCKMLAFAGIHTFSPRLFPFMQPFPDRFGIIDFYLSVCHRVKIVGHIEKELQLMDVGKLETIGQADAFVERLQHS